MFLGAFTLFTFSPMLTWELCYGSDLFWGIIILCSGYSLLDRDHPVWGMVLIGLGLCTRMSFFLLLPMLACVVVRKYSFRRAASYLAITAAVLIVLILPFALWNWDAFWSYAPVMLTKQKMMLPFPELDNAISDTLNLVLGSGETRAWIITLVLLSGSLVAGFLITPNAAGLSMGTALLFSASLFFLGPFFLFDYLIWVYVPLINWLSIKGFAESAK